MMQQGLGSNSVVIESVPTHHDAIVLGAGITGLVSASELLSQGCRNILVADEYPHLGGNHIDWSCGDYTFDVGSFIFQDDSPLLRHFPELLSLYVPILPSWARLNPQGMVTAYPISLKDDILAAGPAEVVRILASVARARLFQRNQQNAREFARYWIGERLLHRSGLEAYMQRFYGVEPAEIDIKLAQKRMLWISENASLSSLMRRVLGMIARKPPAPPTNRQLARPREGFQQLYALARQRLEASGVTFMLGTEFRRLEKLADGFQFSVGDVTVTSDRVVSTIPINSAEALCGLPSLGELQSIRLISLFFSFAGDRGFTDAVLYNFSHEGSWKRITVYSDFYGPAAGREYFTAEVIARDGLHTSAAAEEEFRRHVAANRLFDGDLRLEGSFSLDNAYPIYSKKSDERAAAAVAALGALGVESFGRQGGFNYQPTARVSTIEAEAALKAGRR